ncbi:MAG TPA: tetratricopeptide repeat protein [Candidatus Acidoferrum sp.]|nr:tetratricopeptide repeat protein [Candidatus Acidoferrum sp.]
MQSSPFRTTSLETRALFIAAVLPVCLVLAGCLLDPNARKQKFIAQGDRYVAQEKYPEALLTYGRALQIDSKSAEVHYKVAQCNLKMSNWASAYRELQRTLQLDPQNFGAQLNLGQLYLAGGRAADAKDLALTILKSKPDHVDVELLLAKSDAQLGNVQDALQEAARAVKMFPDNADAYVSFASIQQKASLFQDAEANLLKAGKLSPDSIVPAIALGNLYAAEKQWNNAAAAFRTAITIAPKNPNPRAALAGVYIARNQGDMAEEVLKEAKVQLRADPAGYRMLGDYYLNQGDTSKALTEFASLAREHPADLDARKSYAQLLILSHRVDEASKLTDEVLNRSPQDDGALVLRGQILLQTGKINDALQTLQQAVKANPANAFGHYQLGMAYLAKGIGSQAEGEWRAATRIRPDLTDAWVALGKVATDRRDWATLEQIALQIVKISPASPGGYLFQATARMNQNDTAGAEADLKQLIRVAPQNPIGYTKLGKLRAFTKRWNEAEALYREALNHSPNFLDAIQGIVELDFQRGKPANAIQFVQERINTDPNNAALYLLQGQVFVHANLPADARQAFSHCVELDKQNLSGFLMLAKVEQSLGDVSGAIAHYRQAIAITPTNAGLYTALGTLHEILGNWQEAQGLYQRALALRPDEPLAANNLAYILLEHGGNVNVALTLAQTARRGFPNLPNSADTLGWAYYQNAAYSLAAPLLEDAVKGAPSNATYRYHLGMTYDKLNDLRKARIELEKSIRMDPQAPSAEKASRALSALAGG